MVCVVNDVSVCVCVWCGLLPFNVLLRCVVACCPSAFSPEYAEPACSRWPSRPQSESRIAVVLLPGS